LENLQDKNIGVLMGGLSPEREISLITGNSILQAIKNKGLNAMSIEVDHNIAVNLKDSGIDLAFIALHGTYGEDGTIQGLLDYAQIPYTGPGVLGSAIAYDKVKSKELFKANDIPSADYRVVHINDRKNITRPFDLPVVVKPPNQGSSIGITIVNKEEDWQSALDLAFKYSDEILIEEFISGRLLAIGMQEEIPMPVVHIKPNSGFYDYEAKYTEGKTQYICPADLSAEEEQRCKETATQVFKVLKGRGYPRVDIILDDKGVPYVLEMNTIPGMTPTSLLPMAAKEMGLEFDGLVIEILKTARATPAH